MAFKTLVQVCAVEHFGDGYVADELNYNTVTLSTVAHNMETVYYSKNEVVMNEVVGVTVVVSSSLNLVGDKLCLILVCDNAGAFIVVACFAPPTVTTSVVPCKPILIPLDTSWFCLFTKLPSNAGAYSPCNFETVEVDGVMIPPKEVNQVGKDFWFDY